MLGRSPDATTLLSQFHLPIMRQLGNVDTWSIICNVALNSETHKRLSEISGKNAALQTLARLSRELVCAGPECVMVVTAPVKPTSTGLLDPRFRASTNEAAARLLMRTLVSLLQWIHGAPDAR